MIRSGNPALNESRFREIDVVTGDTMSISGTVNRTGILFLVLLIGASISWNVSSQYLTVLLWTGLFGGLVTALVTIVKKQWSPVTAPVYAFLEGLLLGAISVVYAGLYDGIVYNAVVLTMGTFAAMLFIYKSGFINVTNKFRTGVLAATGGIALVYFISIVLSFFGTNLSLIHGSGIFGIGFSLVIVAVAALNLILDFDFIENASKQGLPSYYDWYAAFGLLVTLVWLYLELLRLLAKLQRR